MAPIGDGVDEFLIFLRLRAAGDDKGLAVGFGPEGAVGPVRDEIHDLDRGVDDAEAVHVLLQRGGEDLLVEFHQHVLARFVAVEAAGVLADAFMEGLRVADLVIEAALPEILPQRIRCPGHRIGGGEVVVLEQRFEDRRTGCTAPLSKRRRHG